MKKEAQKMLNKRAQFFVIFAVIIGVLMLAAVSRVNRVNKNEDSAMFFYLACENYKNEIFKISEYAINTSNKSGEFELIFNFTETFIYNLNKSYALEMFYLYGNLSNVTIVNRMNNLITIRKIGGNTEIPSGTGTTGLTPDQGIININYGTFLKSYNFDDYDKFYFYMKAKKEKDVYVCE
jgi:hypothetical protein